MRKETGTVYCGLTRVSGALVFLSGARGVSYGEMVEVRGADGKLRLGRVLVASEEVVAVEVYQGTEGISATQTRVRFLGHPLEVPVSREMLGRTTEGQIVLERELDRRGIYPPINVLPSLSRLMNDGIGPGRTREDHAHLSNQLYSAYAHVRRVRMLAATIAKKNSPDGIRCICNLAAASSKSSSDRGARRAGRSRKPWIAAGSCSRKFPRVISRESAKKRSPGI